MKLLSSKEQKSIEQVIKKAGANLLTYQNRSSVEQKSSVLASIVTQADIDTENFLREHLSKLFPDFGFYSEETFITSPQELEKEYCWVVDPIDGTLNFSRNLHLFAISVALMYQKKPIFGAVFLPRLNEYFCALKNQGAFLNKQPIKIRKNTSIDHLFGASIIGLGKEGYKQFIDLRFKHKWESAHTYSAVYNYVQTAAGLYDFTLSINLALWDIAAGWIIVEEAGGAFEIFYKDQTDFQKNDPYHIWSIAGDKPIVEQIIKEVKQTWL